MDTIRIYNATLHALSPSLDRPVSMSINGKVHTVTSVHVNAHGSEEVPKEILEHSMVKEMLANHKLIVQSTPSGHFQGSGENTNKVTRPQTKKTENKPAAFGTELVTADNPLPLGN